MNTSIKSAAFAIAFSIVSPVLFAQTPPPPPTIMKDRNNENIIIHRKAESNEKVTIVVDGDKVTVNGKPIDEFKSDNIEITRDEDVAPFGVAVDRFPQLDRVKMYGDLMHEFKGNKAFLGVTTEKTDDGAKITEVTDESAADKAGLKQGDVITKINDDKIATSNDLYKAVGKYKPEDKVTVAYKRDGKDATATATLGSNNRVHAYSYNFNKDGKDFSFSMPPGGFSYSGDAPFLMSDKPRMGLQVQDTEEGKGVKVLDVDDESPAEKAGLKEDDIITSVNGKNVNSVDELKEAVKDGKPGDTFKLNYMRNNQSQSAEVKFPKELKTTDL